MTDSPPDLMIYGSPVSPFVRKVMAVAMDKFAAFELESVNIMAMPEWFLEISPMKRIPVLRDRSIGTAGVPGTIADSSAICAYIDAKHPQPALYPADPYVRGRALMIEEYADTMLAPVGGLGLFRPVFFNVIQGQEPDLETARETWNTKLPPVLDYLETTLGKRPYFVGEEPTIADISVACVFMQLTLVADLTLDRFSALAEFIERMLERPAIAQPYAQAERIVRKALPERVNLT
jgi:glutathione S-transferase